MANSKEQNSPIKEHQRKQKKKQESPQKFPIWERIRNPQGKNDEDVPSNLDHLSKKNKKKKERVRKRRGIQRD